MELILSAEISLDAAPPIRDFSHRRHLHIRVNDSTALFAFHALFDTRGCSTVLGVLECVTQPKRAQSSSNACHQQACYVMDLDCVKTIEHRRCQLASTIPRPQEKRQTFKRSII